MVRAINDESIGYVTWTNGKNAFVSKDLTSGREVTLFVTNKKILAADVDPSGRYVLLGLMSRAGLLNWGVKPIVIDRHLGTTHVLPVFSYYTGCMAWAQLQEESSQ